MPFVPFPVFFLFFFYSSCFFFFFFLRSFSGSPLNSILNLSFAVLAKTFFDWSPLTLSFVFFRSPVMIFLIAPQAPPLSLLIYKHLFSTFHLQPVTTFNFFLPLQFFDCAAPAIHAFEARLLVPGLSKFWFLINCIVPLFAGSCTTLPFKKILSWARYAGFFCVLSRVKA